MSYIKPQEVLSPKNKVGGVLEVVHDPGEGQMAVARILWDEDECVALRWNGNSKQPLGNPMSRRHPTWFVVSGEVADAVLTAARLAADKSSDGLQAQYRAMAADEEREREAQEWCEGVLREPSGD
jgi:hypothetical protein